MIAVARPQWPLDRSGPSRPGIRPVPGEPLDRTRQLGIQVERALEVPDRLHGAALGLLVLAAEVKFHRAAEGLQQVSR